MDTQINLTLTPVYWDNRYPEIRILWDNCILFSGTVQKEETKSFTVSGDAGLHNFVVEFVNKHDSDTVLEKQLDKAIVINQIEVEGMSFSSFMYQAGYYPNYPDAYKVTCAEQNIVLEPRISSTYLGWNGKWVLPISFPVFTWIHETENLGWIYERNI
jgi:hypothetical protein